jgi:hypothetical protein
MRLPRTPCGYRWPLRLKERPIPLRTRSKSVPGHRGNRHRHCRCQTNAAQFRPPTAGDTSRVGLSGCQVRGVSDLAAIEDKLSGYDACFFCLGVSSVGMKEERYRRVTYDLTVSVAKTLRRCTRVSETDSCARYFVEELIGGVREGAWIDSSTMEIRRGGTIQDPCAENPRSMHHENEGSSDSQFRVCYEFEFSAVLRMRTVQK